MLAFLNALVDRTTELLAVADTASRARAADHRCICWIEHVSDDPIVSGIDISGRDGLNRADLDRDGLKDIASVHQADTTYDAVPTDQVRIAWFENPARDIVAISSWIRHDLSRGKRGMYDKMAGQRPGPRRRF